MIWTPCLILAFLQVTCAQWLLLEEDGPQMLTSEAEAKIPARHECGAWCIGDDVYVYGGSNENGVLNDFWKYETENRRWLWMPQPPATLKGLKNFAHWTIQEEAYLYGGDTALHGIQDLMWKYDPLTRAWVIQSPLALGPTPGALERAAFWTHKPSNQLYLFGGWDGNATRQDLWSYNIATKTWRQWPYSGASPSPNTMGRAVLGKSEDTVFYFSDRLYQLDIPTLTWSVSPINSVAPESREQYALFMSSTQDKLSLFSGHQGSKLYSDYWLYDPSIEEWIKTDSSGGIPSGRWGSCGCTDARGDYYMFGGTFEDPKHFHNDLWKNGPLSAKNIFQLLDFKLDSVTLSSLVAAAMSTILVCILFFALLCVCVRKCRRERHLINSYKADNGPLNENISL